MCYGVWVLGIAGYVTRCGVWDGKLIIVNHPIKHIVYPTSLCGSVSIFMHEVEIRIRHKTEY